MSDRTMPSWQATPREYAYDSAEHTPAHGYLLPAVVEILGRRLTGADRRVFDLGCGNGSVASALASRGYDVTGVDPSEQGIAQANAAVDACTAGQSTVLDEIIVRPGVHQVDLASGAGEDLAVTCDLDVRGPVRIRGASPRY